MVEATVANVTASYIYSTYLSYCQTLVLILHSATVYLSAVLHDQVLDGVHQIGGGAPDLSPEAEGGFLKG